MKECVAEYRDIPVEEIPSYIENDPQLDVSVVDETDKIQGRNSIALFGFITIQIEYTFLRFWNSEFWKPPCMFFCFANNLLQ